MKIAIDGCCHGELDRLYESIREVEEKKNIKVDLLICCGDFQCVRMKDDLEFMACPLKYKEMKDFHYYYSGAKIAPVLTIFVGGNHEAQHVLKELYFGGWVAPNIFYLGYSGVVNVGNLRIAGISGIYKEHDYRKGHFELLPLTPETNRSAFHVREYEVKKLGLLTGDIDIIISHDWPESIYEYGDVATLLRTKKHFFSDIQNNNLGNPHTMRLLKALKPTFWFSGHLHVKFAALVPHTDKIKFTKFLALDKILPDRQFLQILEIDTSTPQGQQCSSPLTNSSSPVSILFDNEWLAILRANHTLAPTSRYSCSCDVVYPRNEDKKIIHDNLKRFAKLHKSFGDKKNTTLDLRTPNEYTVENGNHFIKNDINEEENATHNVSDNNNSCNRNHSGKLSSSDHDFKGNSIKNDQGRNNGNANECREIIEKHTIGKSPDENSNNTDNNNCITDCGYNSYKNNNSYNATNINNDVCNICASTTLNINNNENIIDSKSKYNNHNDHVNVDEPRNKNRNDCKTEEIECVKKQKKSQNDSFENNDNSNEYVKNSHFEEQNQLRMKTKEKELYKWPRWDEINYKDLEQQRAFVLKIIGIYPFQDFVSKSISYCRLNINAPKVENVILSNQVTERNFGVTTIHESTSVKPEIKEELSIDMATLDVIN